MAKIGPARSAMVVRLDVTPAWWEPAREWYTRDPVGRQQVFQEATAALVAHVLLESYAAGLHVHEVHVTRLGVGLDLSVPADATLQRVQAHAAALRTETEHLDPRPAS